MDSSDKQINCVEYLHMNIEGLDISCLPSNITSITFGWLQYSKQCKKYCIWN